MAVTGHYMAFRVRFSAIPYVQAYGDCVLSDVMSAFTNLEKRADAIANAEFERLGSEPAGEDCDVDMGALAEAAEDKGQAFYETMSSLRQTTLNLFAAGLFHLVEQHLADLCHDGAFTVAPPHDTNRNIICHWYQQHFELDLRALKPWPKIDELQLVANAVKHAEGPSARRLRQLRPELFQQPAVRERLPGIPDPVHPIRMPLAGDDLYITEQSFEEYRQAANQLFTDIANHFEAHGEEYYPRR